jgi:iron complex outermembrane recepter protein
MKRALIFLVAALFSMSAHSQGKITGVVKDSSNKNAVPYTKILLVEANIIKSTDLEGRFTISAPAGTYKMKVSFGVGYIDKDLTVTIKNGETTKLGDIYLRPDVIGLEEIAVFADFVDEQSQLPTPVTNISAEDFEQKLGAQEFPEMMKSVPGVFVSTVGGSFGDASVRVRGFGSENTAVLINGIPVNDMESGQVFWSNWGGMNDVTRNQQIQRGLGATKLAVNSVGGTINILTKPTDYKKGVKLSYSSSNRSYSDMLMLSMSTGQMKNGWAVTALGSTRQGFGWREGTKANAYSYFLTVSKEINQKHLIMFTGFGAPQESWGGRQATLRSYDLVRDSTGAKNRTYNPAWGYQKYGQNGDSIIRSAAINRYHKPVFMLNHNFYVNSKTTLTTGLYYSFGKGGGTTINRTNNTIVPVPFNLLPGAGDSTYQVQWDYMINENLNNLDTIANVDGLGKEEEIIGKRSKYVQLESRNDHSWFGAITTLNHKFTDLTNVTFGLDYRWYRGYHYQVVEDLMGGDFWVDRERFNSLPDNNLLEPNNISRVGDTVGYNYNGNVTTVGAFSQVQHTIKNIDLFATFSYSNTQYYRNGLFLHAEFVESSLGYSAVQSFDNYTAKAGANYRINGRHNVFLNAGKFTRAPFFRNAFIDNRISNIYREGISNEDFFSIEGGYGYRSPKVSANLNVYSTQWNNRSYVVGFPSEVYSGDFVNYVMNNVNALHQGIELDGKFNVINNLSLTAMLSIGDWRYNGNADAIVLRDPGLNVLTNPDSGLPTTEDPVSVYIDDLKVGGVAQTTGAIGFHYRGKKYWYVGGSANYFDNMYADFNPETKTSPEPFFNQVERLPWAYTMDIYAGKSWKVKNYFIQLKANINNLFNNQFIVDSNQRNATITDPEPSPFVQFYFGRTYFLGLSVSF